MEIIIKRTYYEEENIVRRKVSWEGKDYQKKVSSERNCYYNKSAMIKN